MVRSRMDHMAIGMRESMKPALKIRNEKLVETKLQYI